MTRPANETSRNSHAQDKQTRGKCNTNTQITAYKKHNGKQENPAGGRYNIQTEELKYYETHDSLNTSTEKNNVVI